MLKRALLAACLPLTLTACQDPPAEGEGEGEGEEGEGEEGEGEEGEGEEGEGEGEGEDPCPLVDPCAGVAVSPAVVEFRAGGVVAVDDDVFTVGTTTRADIEAALGAGAVDDNNDFRVTYCGVRLVAQFVDNDGTLTTDPAAAAGDVLSRVLTLADSAATSSLSTAIGEPPPNTAVATATSPVGDGDIFFFGAAGQQLLVSGDGLVVQIGAFKPQTGDHWTLPLTLEADEQALSDLRRDATFGEASALLGADFDAEGVLDAGFVGDVFVRIWSSTGVRIAGLCGQDPCGDDTPISSITLSPPFFGKDTGVGIGSTRAELEADVGTGTADGEIIVYGEEDPFGNGDPALGVVYVQDAQCVERAAAFVFNYVSLD